MYMHAYKLQVALLLVHTYTGCAVLKLVEILLKSSFIAFAFSHSSNK